MRHRILRICVCTSMALAFTLHAVADQRGVIYSLGLDLEKRASYIAQSSFEHFKGWNGEISDDEQAVLFMSEAFAASCRLFLKLTEERSDYFSSGYLRTNLYNAFLYLDQIFKALEEEMKGAGVQPYELNDCRKILARMEDEFARWPSADNLAFLHQKYVKASDASVYLIERVRTGEYIRRPFKSLESLFRYNYDYSRGKDPWKYLVEVSENTLYKLDEGDMIDLTFEGELVIEQSNRPNRPVFLIKNGKKCGITSPQVLERFGGWGKVFEVPAEVIRSYPEGDPIY